MLPPGTIVGVSVAILVVLFAVQQFGTSKIGYAFAPIMATFLGFNSVIGVYNIAKYQPSIFKVRGSVASVQTPLLTAAVKSGLIA